MTDRAARLLAAGGYLVGVCLFVAGLAVDVAVSVTWGSIAVGIGAVMTLCARIMARRRGLPAP